VTKLQPETDHAKLINRTKEIKFGALSKKNILYPCVR
jgi:hypothetical protein